MVMGQEEDIPCAACKSWNAETKSFSCDPNKCSKLSGWLLEKAPQLNTEIIYIPETPLQYVV